MPRVRSLFRARTARVRRRRDRMMALLASAAQGFAPGPMPSSTVCTVSAERAAVRRVQMGMRRKAPTGVESQTNGRMADIMGQVRRTGLAPQPSRLKIDLPLTRASPALDSRPQSVVAASSPAMAWTTVETPCRTTSPTTSARRSRRPRSRRRQSRRPRRPTRRPERRPPRPQ